MQKYNISVKVIIDGPGYNDTGLRVLASIESDTLWQQSIPDC